MRISERNVTSFLYMFINFSASQQGASLLRLRGSLYIPDWISRWSSDRILSHMQNSDYSLAMKLSKQNIS